MSNKSKKVQNEVKTLRETALSFAVETVDATVAAIRESFVRRDAFELSQGLDISAKNSYTTERGRMLANERAVAMFFLALGIEPHAVIERKVASNAMFNAKALKKVTELAQFTCGYGQRLERVMRAFIACAIIATERGHDVITNDVNRAFLCSRGFGDRIKDADLIAHLDELRHRAMTSGAETQSSQSRNVLDVLGLGSIRSIDAPRDAIALNAEHAFFAQFAEAFMN
jgi:hypothetical protein